MNKKILVVDDDKDILDALDIMLSMENYIVHTTSKGEEALSCVRKVMPDLLILDVLMSGTDGRDICRMVKTSDELSKIPVIMISAHPNAEESVKKVGADAFLAKPFDIDMLLERVDTLSN